MVKKTVGSEQRRTLDGEMNLIITGSRHYNDFSFFCEKMDSLTMKLNLKNLIVHVGDCPTGVDKLVERWCDKHYVMYKRYRAEWNKLGTKAGPIRNGEMVAGVGKKGNCVAFYDGKTKSSGTLDCINQAKKAGLKIKIVRVEIKQV